jgi:uncharacterized protein YbaP (TraB family)
MPNEQFSLRLAICLCSAFIATALCTTAEAASACVWRVTSVEVPFYLVGTLHALSGTDYPLPKPYSQALHDSKRFVFELDPNPKSDFPERFVKAAIYPKGDDIRSHVHGKTWEFLSKNFKVSNYFGKTLTFNFGNVRRLDLGHYQVSGIEQLRPWAIAYFIWDIHGYNDVFSSHGVDNHFAYQAQRAGKETAGLETVQEHVDVLRGMTDIDSEIILLDAVIRGDKRRDDYNKLRAAWKRGDVAAIWAEEQRFRNESPGADVRLLDERNVRWIPRIKAEMRTGKPTSIVVGSAHFCGPNGLLQLLQRGGYKLEQL